MKFQNTQKSKIFGATKFIKDFVGLKQFAIELKNLQKSKISVLSTLTRLKE